MELMRSLLFAPGNHARRVEKAFTLDADVVILDLEDAVALAQKVGTRDLIVTALKLNQPRDVLGYVRVNSFETDFCHADIQAVMGDWLDGLMLPKVESAAQMQAVEWMMASIERERGLPEGKIDLLPIIETGLGMTRVREIAESGTRAKRLSFGAGDYTGDLNLIWTQDEMELLTARAEVVLASRAAGMEPPLDSVFIDLNDNEHLEKSAVRGREMGFQGKLCIHPKQLDAVNRAYSPTDDEVAKAEKYAAAFQEAEAAGSASIQVDGYFVDYPIVERAERTLALIERIRAKQK
jgi:citrate lyase subunit beta/citryl-CoA lyase